MGRRPSQAREHDASEAEAQGALTWAAARFRQAPCTPTHATPSAVVLDAIAIGQVTPGPVFTTATFVGYLLGGVRGAGAATVGIFLPAFVFVALSGVVLPRIRRSPTAGAVPDGVNVAALALMVVVAWQLGRSALVDPLTTGLAVAVSRRTPASVLARCRPSEACVSVQTNRYMCNM